MVDSEKKRNQPLPILVSDKGKCCGCGACYAICPVKAIRMIPDARGFVYPEVKGESCVRCWKCVKICIFK